jgi:hypothetical protein
MCQAIRLSTNCKDRIHFVVFGKIMNRYCYKKEGETIAMSALCKAYLVLLSVTTFKHLNKRCLNIDTESNLKVCFRVY